MTQAFRPKKINAELCLCGDTFLEQWEAKLGPDPSRCKDRSPLLQILGSSSALPPRSIGRGKSEPRALNSLPTRLQWGPGLLAGESSPTDRDQRPSTGFNGAPVCWPGKGASAGSVISTRPRLQWGPGLLAGERRAVERERYARDALQWGPGLLAGERIPRRRGGREVPHASMGPRSVGRGKDAAPAPEPARGGASMGPRSVGRGKVDALTNLPWRDMLQWGPGLLAGERSRSRNPP